MFTPAEEQIRLAIGGHAHEHWDGWSVESDLLTPADAFQLELFTQDTVALPTQLREGAPCTLSLGNDRILTGVVDEVELDISRQGRTIRINGRDHASVLVDCSTPFVAMREVGLADVIEQVVRPLGITQVEIRATKAGSRKRIQVEPGQSAWEVLLQAAEANGLWPWMEPDGRLVVGGPDYSAPPVAELILREDGQGNNVERLSLRRSMPGRFSQVTVLGQHGQYDGDGYDTTRSKLKTVVKDDVLASRGIFRPKVVIDSSCENQDMSTARARKLLADSRLEGLEIRAVVQGHRTDRFFGEVWTPGQRIIVRSELHDLDATYFLMSRTLRVTRREGAITELRLREDKMWVLDGNKSKKQKKRKGDADAAFIQELHKL